MASKSGLVLLFSVGLSITAVQAESLLSGNQYERNATIRELESRARYFEDQNKKAKAQLKKATQENSSRSTEGRTPLPGAENSPRIVNGVMTALYPSTGALLLSNNGAFRFQCTGTIIGCKSFLTAAHCIDKNPSSSDYQVYLQHGGLFQVQHIEYQADKFDFPHADMAVLTLSRPVTGIAPTKLNKVSQVPLSTKGTIVGFGRRGGSHNLYGIKQIGHVTTSDCTLIDKDYHNTDFVCWKFDAPVATPGENSNTCNGDSGGPMFAKLGTNPRDLIAGVTSGGRNAECLAKDQSYDSQVFAYTKWLDEKCGTDLTGECDATLPKVGFPGTKIKASDGELNTSISAKEYEVVIPQNVSLVRFAMNGEDDGLGTRDFDLYVRYGEKPSLDRSDCRDDGPGQFAVCEFSNPRAGTWHVMVKQKTGIGAFQIVATYFTKTN